MKNLNSKLLLGANVATLAAALSGCAMTHTVTFDRQAEATPSQVHRVTYRDLKETQDDFEPCKYGVAKLVQRKTFGDRVKGLLVGETRTEEVFCKVKP